MNDEFYVGYLDESPPRLARHSGRVAIALVLGAAVLMALAGSRQGHQPPGTFEYGSPREFEGVLFERPLPILRQTTPDGAVTSYLLVGAGKFGLPGNALGHDHERVKVTGTLIRSSDGVMIELAETNAIHSLGPEAPTGTREPEPRVLQVGTVSLTGELVDTKCHFGVMRPGTGKIHRACAVRCLSGGIPPGLLIQSKDGTATTVLLTGPNGNPLAFNPEWAARRLRANGSLTFRDGVPVLAVNQLALID